MLFWRKPALTPTKNYENKTVCVFFQGASDGNVKVGRNIAQKLKNKEILIFLIYFSKYFFGIAGRPIRPIDRSDRSEPKKVGGLGGLCPPSKKHAYIYLLNDFI